MDRLDWLVLGREKKKKKIHVATWSRRFEVATSILRS